MFDTADPDSEIAVRARITAYCKHLADGKPSRIVRRKPARATASTAPDRPLRPAPELPRGANAIIGSGGDGGDDAEEERQTKARARAALLDQEGLDEDDSDDEDSGGELVLDPAVGRHAALPPSASIAAAQQRIREEDEAFARRKTVKKAGKIKASISQQWQAEVKRHEKEDRKAEKAKARQEKPSKGLADYFGFDRNKKDEKKEPEAKAEKSRIEIAQANKKSDDKAKKFGSAPLSALQKLGVVEKGLASGIGETISADNAGDDIASAAGSVAASTAAAAECLVQAFRSFNLYRKTQEPEQSQHLKDATKALGAAVGNLVTLTRGTLNIAEGSGALDAGAAVPILGIVAAIPSLLIEINDLRSAMTRLAKQQKTYRALDKQLRSGDMSQQTLHTTVGSFIATDVEAIGKGITKVTLSFAKIAGHGVTAGGITGPVGVALVAVGAAGKLLLSGVGTVEGYVAAGRANDRRKKLQPTLNAAAGWAKVSRELPESSEVAGLTKALAILARAERGSAQHGKALDVVGTFAAAVRDRNVGATKVVAFAQQLIEQVGQEREAWQRAASTDAGGDVSPVDDAGQSSPLERNARKLIKTDPQVAAQILIDQARREGQPGGPAFRVLKSFGIKASHVYGGQQGDELIGINREMRQKILLKLGADDGTAQTLTQTIKGARDGARDYLAFPGKHRELQNYMRAKDLLMVGGKKERGVGWQLKMDLLTDDIEEKKAALLEQVHYLLEPKVDGRPDPNGEPDIDLDLADRVMALLAPRR
ncbi:MAG: hypothetical protein KDC98_09000 [Planctomycetes bacterium]|nr:hypothetical protein [Planctomycetota bacterium]